MPKPREVVEHILPLVKQYPVARLVALAELFMRWDTRDLQGKPRSLGLFRHYVPTLDGELRKAGYREQVPA
jgi:hypothetical protein